MLEGSVRVGPSALTASWYRASEPNTARGKPKRITLIAQ